MKKQTENGGVTGRSLEDFKREHDPMFVGDSPVPVWDWKPNPKQKRFLFTAAQNATPVDLEWWAVLCAAAKSMGAEICVLPVRYKNPTSAWSGSQKNAEHWVPEVLPYLVNTRVQINPNLQLMADIKIQLTAGDPVGSGRLATVSGASSAIIGHPKIQTRSIATPQNRTAKLLMTSGMCTVSNYSDSGAGGVAAHHHSLSAMLVELDGKKFYARRLHYDAKTKSATDSAAGVRYTAKGAARAPRALALVLGDLHNDFKDPKVMHATFGKDGMVETARPKHIVYHDIVDGYSANPHHGKNPFNKIAKTRGALDDVQQEMCRVESFLREHTYPNTKSVIVTSNHDDFIKRWIIDADWRDDPVNAEFYLETALDMVRHTELGESGAEYPNPFAKWMRNTGIPQLRVIEEDESFALADVELGMHGHRGPNGSRGSIRNLRRIGVKSIIGHSHSPGEDEGCTQVGTSTGFRLEYNSGPSSWLQAHCFLGADGKRQLCVIVDGKYRL